MGFKFLRWRHKRAAKAKSASPMSIAVANQRDEESVISTTESAISTIDWIPQIPRWDDLSNPDPILRQRTTDTFAYGRRRSDSRRLDYTFEDDIETPQKTPSLEDTRTAFNLEVDSIATSSTISSASTYSDNITIDDVDDSSTLSGSTFSGSDNFTYNGCYDDHYPNIFDDHEPVPDLFQIFDVATDSFLKLTNCYGERSHVLSG
jgi:hypothetical protein